MLPDQMNLLQGTWLDVLCFGIAFRSSPYQGMLVFADDFQMSDTDDACIPRELNLAMRTLAKKLSDLSLIKEEFVLMKAILLLNPGEHFRTFAFKPKRVVL